MSDSRDDIPSDVNKVPRRKRKVDQASLDVIAAVNKKIQEQKAYEDVLKKTWFNLYYVDNLDDHFHNEKLANSYILVKNSKQLFYVDQNGDAEVLAIDDEFLEEPLKKLENIVNNESSIMMVLSEFTEDELKQFNDKITKSGGFTLNRNEELRNAFGRFDHAKILDRIQNRPQNELLSDSIKTFKPDEIVSGPLNKNQETRDLEDIIKSLLENKSNVLFERMDDTIHVTYSKNTPFTYPDGNQGVKVETIKSDLNRILKFANLTHIRFSKEQEEAYMNFLETSTRNGGSQYKPDVPASVKVEGFWKHQHEIRDVGRKKLWHEKFRLMEADIDDNDKQQQLRHLSRGEKMALNIYTGKEFRAMNTLLRQQQLDKSVDSSDEISELLLHSMMASAALNKVGDNPAKINTISRRMGTDQLDATAEGIIQSQNAFTSTSSEKPKASTFSKLDQHQIGMIITGAPLGGFLDALSQMNGENEYLLPPGTQLHWRGRIEEEGAYVAWAHAVVSPSGLKEKTEEELSQGHVISRTTSEKLAEPSVNEANFTGMTTNVNKSLNWIHLQIQNLASKKTKDKSNLIQTVLEELERSRLIMNHETEAFNLKWNKTLSSINDGSYKGDPSTLEKQFIYERHLMESYLTQYQSALSDLSKEVDDKRKKIGRKKTSLGYDSEKAESLIGEMESIPSKMTAIDEKSCEELGSHLKKFQDDYLELSAEIHKIRSDSLELYKNISNFYSSKSPLDDPKSLEDQQKNLEDQLSIIKAKVDNLSSQYAKKTLNEYIEFIEDNYLHATVPNVKESELLLPKIRNTFNYINTISKRNDDQDTSQRIINLCNESIRFRQSLLEESRNIKVMAFSSDDKSAQIVENLFKEHQALSQDYHDLLEAGIHSNQDEVKFASQALLDIIYQNLNPVSELFENKSLLEQIKEIQELGIKERIESLERQKLAEKEEKLKSENEKVEVEKQKEIEPLNVEQEEKKVEHPVQPDESGYLKRSKEYPGMFKSITPSQLIKKLVSDQVSITQQVEKNMDEKYGSYDYVSKKNRYDIYYESCEKQIHRAKLAGNQALVSGMIENNATIIKTLDSYIGKQKDNVDKQDKVALAISYKEKIEKLNDYVHEIAPKKVDEVRYDKNVFTTSAANYEDAKAAALQLLNVPVDTPDSQVKSMMISDEKTNEFQSKIESTTNQHLIAPIRINNTLHSCLVRSEDGTSEVISQNKKPVSQLINERQTYAHQAKMSNLYTARDQESLPSVECMLLALNTFDKYFSGKPYRDIYYTGNGENLEALAIVCRLHTLANPNQPVRCRSDHLVYHLLGHTKVSGKDLDHKIEKMLDRKIAIQMKLAQNNGELMAMIHKIQHQSDAEKERSVKGLTLGGNE